jgi:nucleoside 2-deoxyribosyltransferase
MGTKNSEKAAGSRKKIFIICPVRNASGEDRKALLKYVESREREGISVHYPARDTDQDDPVGLDICRQNRDAIAAADEVHVLWDPKSAGSLFDFGMAFALDKPVVVINISDVEETPSKSFSNVLRRLDQLGREGRS